jgi:protein-tyrosine kinase
MSRIHEALKRAEQERAANSAVGGEAFPPESLPSLGRAAAPPAVTGAPPGASEISDSTAVLTPELVRARTSHSRWSPDPGSTLFADVQDRAPGTEEFRSLRSRLYQIREKHPLQTLLVTSALAGEGKTFVAVNLARAIVQQHGRAVLLIDSDLRISRIHLTLGAPAAPGLSDYLLGEADLFSVLQQGAPEGLFFIPGGRSVPNPAELIGSGRLKLLLQRLAPAFDWILLDSPPSVPLTDASLLAEMSDGVLMVVRAGETPYDMAQKGCRQFRDRRLVGVVLNGIPETSSYSAYYYYAGNGQK